MGGAHSGNEDPMTEIEPASWSLSYCHTKLLTSNCMRHGTAVHGTYVSILVLVYKDLCIPATAASVITAHNHSNVCNLAVSVILDTYSVHGIPTHCIMHSILALGFQAMQYSTYSINVLSCFHVQCMHAWASGNVIWHH